MQELWFLCMICRLKVLYKCMKFRFHTSYCYQVIEQAQNSIANDQREMIPNISKAEFMVLVHDTFSECALQMYAVSLKYL